MQARDCDVLIRADASALIGTGHVLRCVVLANWLKREGLAVAFAMRALEGNLIELVRSLGHEVLVLDDRGAGANATWLGVDLEAEVEAMHLLLKRHVRPRWVVVDHYELDSTWENSLLSQGVLVCAIDDLADRPHNSDLLLDATLDQSERYDLLVPSRTRRFLGLKYAPLRDAFAVERAHSRPRNGSIERVLVFYGGVDWSGETLKALTALRQVQGNFTIDVVTGALNPRLHEIQEAIAGDPRACLQSGGAEMASLTASADLALGAIGTAMWERCFVGCPAIVTATLEKTRTLGPMLQESGAIEWLGFAADVSPRTIQNAFLQLNENPDKLREIGARAFALADGYVEARAEFVQGFM